MHPKPSFLPLLRELARTYQAFERYSAAHVHAMGLTAPQFDVLATLGNTAGMSPKQLADRTLITKGTLTGVIDRLVVKGLVHRLPDPVDRRRQIVRLTPTGQRLFERVFPAHLAHLARAFEQLDTRDQEQALHALEAVRVAFDDAASQDAPTRTKGRT